MKRCNIFYPVILGLIITVSLGNAQIHWTQTGPSETVIDIISSNGKSFLLTKNGLYASSDDKSWQMLKSITSSELYNCVVVLKSGEMFLFGYNFYSVSTDGGVNWKKVDQPGFSTRRCISDNLGYLYAGQNDPIKRSTDKGLTWEDSKDGTSGGFFDIAAFAIAPNGDIYAGNQGITGGMVYRSSDHGTTWNPVHSETMKDVGVITVANGTIWIAYSDQLIYSDDDGANWHTASKTSYPITALLFTEQKKALAGMTSVGLFSTVDGGSGWFSNMSGISGKSIRKLLRSSQNDIFCGTDSGLFYFAAPASDVKEPSEGGSKIMLTPNPAQNEIQVEVRMTNASGLVYEIYDQLGRKRIRASGIVDGGKFQLNTESLDNGSYFFVARSNDEVFTGKLIIAK
jgi:hypothetical protein